MRKLNHFNISLIKSGIRVLAGFYLVLGYLVICGLLIIFAELFGVIEEIVEETK
ncbi:MAG: hypothetical protein WC942_11970 [Clostridia bacterium]|jgi:hypothetical protein